MAYTYPRIRYEDSAAVPVLIVPTGGYPHINVLLVEGVVGRGAIHQALLDDEVLERRPPVPGRVERCGAGRRADQAPPARGGIVIGVPVGEDIAVFHLVRPLRSSKSALVKAEGPIRGVSVAER